MKYLFPLSLLCAISLHAAVDNAPIDVEVTQDNNKKTVQLQYDRPVEMFSISNAQGERASIVITLLKRRADNIVVSFVTEAVRVDRSVRSSQPITVELSLDVDVPILFDIVPGGILIQVKPLKNK